MLHAIYILNIKHKNIDATEKKENYYRNFIKETVTIFTDNIKEKTKVLKVIEDKLLF